MHPAYGVARLEHVIVFERIEPLLGAACQREPPVCGADGGEPK